MNFNKRIDEPPGSPNGRKSYEKMSQCIFKFKMGDKSNIKETRNPRS